MILPVHTILMVFLGSLIKSKKAVDLADKKSIPVYGQRCSLLDVF